MKNIKVSRRGFLGGMAVAPLGAKIAADQTSLKMLNGGYPNFMDSTRRTSEVQRDNKRKVHTFAQWLAAGGEKSLLEESKEFYGFDLDLTVMQSMSFSAKVAIQRRRCLEKARANRKTWFSRTMLRNGFVKIYDEDEY